MILRAVNRRAAETTTVSDCLDSKLPRLPGLSNRARLENTAPRKRRRRLTVGLPKNAPGQLFGLRAVADDAKEHGHDARLVLQEEALESRFRPHFTLHIVLSLALPLSHHAPADLFFRRNPAEVPSRQFTQLA